MDTEPAQIHYLYRIGSNQPGQAFASYEEAEEEAIAKSDNEYYIIADHDLLGQIVAFVYGGEVYKREGDW